LTQTAAQLTAAGLLLQPFDTIAIGVGLDAQGTTATIVYHNADATTAAANAKILANILATGQVATFKVAYSAIFQPATITTDGTVVIATLRMRPGNSPRRAEDLLYESELVAVHS